MKTAVMTRGYLEYYINLIDKVAVGFERVGSYSERSPVVGKMLSNSTACYREVVCERKSHWCGKLHCCLLKVYFQLEDNCNIVLVSTIHQP